MLFPIDDPIESRENIAVEPRENWLLAPQVFSKNVRSIAYKPGCVHLLYEDASDPSVTRGRICGKVLETLKVILRKAGRMGRLELAFLKAWIDASRSSFFAK